MVINENEQLEMSLLTYILHVSLSQEIVHFLSVMSCDSLPLTRLEGLKELTRQLHDNKEQIRELLKECRGTMPDEAKWSVNKNVLACEMSKKLVLPFSLSFL